MIENRSASPGMAAASTYSYYVAGELWVDGEPAPRMESDLHAAFRALIHDPEFPCLGAKSIVNESSYRFALYGEMSAPESTASLASDLRRFIGERPSIKGDFSTFMACFTGPKVCTAEEFEESLWRQLAALHELDREHYSWSDAVSDDPGDPHFGFSFAEHPFFVVGLSPASERWARRFPWPTLVFNDHAQFQRLREEHQFDRLRDLIRERDTRLHGSKNAMLSDFGSHSEARQYAGRQVTEGWRCPVDFHQASEQGQRDGEA